MGERLRHVSLARVPRIAPAWCGAVLLLFCLDGSAVLAQPAGPPAAWPPAVSPAEVAAGEALFTGRTPFANGGPACISCHSVAGLRFPAGGTVGPDLTHVSGKLGPEGLQYAMATLYFPTMTALFRTRPLTSAEQVDLGAYLRQENEAPPPALPVTAGFGVAGLAGFGLLLVATAAAGRRRLHSVRGRLLARARRTGGGA
ncbi:MAG: hypothetical protein KGN76_08100 [Acidobacteriota bacterium]|nr:hypothetical protein [Acidobacteriota bacterium]